VLRPAPTSCRRCSISRFWRRDDERSRPRDSANGGDHTGEAQPEKDRGSGIAGMARRVVGLLLTTIGSGGGGSTILRTLSDGEPPDEPQGYLIFPHRPHVRDRPCAACAPRRRRARRRRRSAHVPPMPHGQPEEETAPRPTSGASADRISKPDTATTARSEPPVVAARGELPSTLQEMAYRWKQRAPGRPRASPIPGRRIEATASSTDDGSTRRSDGRGASVGPCTGDGQAGRSGLRARALVDQAG